MRAAKGAAEPAHFSKHVKVLGQCQTTFVNALANGTSDEQVAADIIGSAEFFAGV
jgi:hypothetical protein